MIFANVLARFDGSELSLPKLRADFANGFSFCWVFGKAHNQTIRELLALFTAVNVGHNHCGRACFIQFLDELSGRTFGCVECWLESAQRTAGFVAILLQPSPNLGAILLFQERTDEDAMNILLRRLVLRRQLRRFTSKLRELSIFGR